MAAKRRHSRDCCAFCFKWGFEVNPVSNNSRMLETEDSGDFASAYMPLKRGLEGDATQKNKMDF